jgi:hypothetical protein
MQIASVCLEVLLNYRPTVQGNCYNYGAGEVSSVSDNEHNNEINQCTECVKNNVKRAVHFFFHLINIVVLPNSACTAYSHTLTDTDYDEWLTRHAFNTKVTSHVTLHQIPFKCPNTSEKSFPIFINLCADAIIFYMQFHAQMDVKLRSLICLGLNEQVETFSYSWDGRHRDNFGESLETLSSVEAIDF